MDKNTGSTDTRKLLLDVSTKLFNEKDFDDVSVNEICRAAGVTKGSFYHHFDSKYEYLFSSTGRYRTLFIPTISTARTFPSMRDFTASSCGIPITARWTS
ncbi:MAG: helix-turn-helix transcriptional regulator [Eubacteriaceae bacterium]|nr:helix-turn-helix transcriptional regulator [Eubacteriaceae bacterium]